MKVEKLIEDLSMFDPSESELMNDKDNMDEKIESFLVQIEQADRLILLVLLKEENERLHYILMKERDRLYNLRELI